jgi:hypothetical protein
MLKLKQLWLQGVQTLLTFILNTVIEGLKLFIKLGELIGRVFRLDRLSIGDYTHYAILIWAGGVLLTLVGWVVNLGKVLFAIPPHLQDVTTLYALRVIGIPAVPLGAALGFF